jgi:photosystem II stability/assembly factor-like uncharacterized protein
MVTASSSTWTLVGPQPAVTVWVPSGNSGRATSIAVDPSNSSIIYLGTADGGVWKTTNDGGTWAPLTDAEPSMATGAIAVDPQAPTTIYVGTGEANQSGDSYYGAGILKSTDGGTTWIQIPGPFVNGGGGGTSFGSLAVDPANSSVILGGTYGGIYRSADAGQTWTAVLPGGTGYSVMFDPLNPTTAYAAMGQIFGSPQNGIYKSSDAGMTWVRLTGTGTNVLPSQNLGRINLVMDPTNSSTLFASISNCCTPFSGIVGIFKTVDGGQNWTQIGNPPSCCDWYANALVVDPGNSNVLFAGSSSLYRSLDGGQTWSFAGSGLHPDLHALAFSPGGATMYAVTDGGIFSTTGPTSATPVWTTLNSTISTIEFYPGMSVDPSNVNRAFAGTQDNGTLTYTGNLVWSWVGCGDGGGTAIDPVNSANVYINCVGVSLEKSTNGGLSFFNAGSGLNTADRAGFVGGPVTVDPNNSQTLYYGTYRLYQSVDGANSWTPISGDLTKGNGVIISTAIAASDSNTVYVTTNDGNVQMTANALAGSGATWTNITGSLPNRNMSAVAVDPQSPNLAYVAVGGFGSGHVFKTSNSGAAWTNITGNLPNAPADDVVVDPDEVNTLYVGTDAGVFGTTDGGQTWSTMVQGLPRVVIQSLRMHHSSRTLRAASHGRSAWDLIVPQDPLLSSTSAVSFSSQNYQTTSAAQGVTLNWNGRSLLGITGITVTGDFAETDNCGSSQAPGGSCAVNVTFTPTAAGTRTGTLAIANTFGPSQSIALSGTGLSTFTLASNPNAVTVQHGTAGVGVFVLTLNPQGGAFNNPILLSCGSGVPPLSSCSFSSASVTPGALSTSSTLTITTTARAVAISGNHRNMQTYAVVILGMPLGVMILLWPSRSRFASAPRGLCILFLALSVLALPSCGGSGGGSSGGGGGQQGTPVGSYSITVNANGTSAQASIVVKLTVQ